MKPLRLLAFATLAFAAACSNDVTSPTVTPEETPAAEAAYIPNPLFQVNFSSTSAFFQAPDANIVPTATAKIMMYSPYAAFATLGPPRVAKVEYPGNTGGWLTGNVELKSAFRADLNLRVAKGMPIGAYQARVTLTLLGVVNYIVNVTFVSGVYFFDCAEVGKGLGPWTFSGLWNLTTGGNTQNSRGATPAAEEGSTYFWYGDPATGDFVDGGQNSGSAISPAFTLPAGAANPVVHLRTWFEIEYDVAPFDYDYMEVYLIAVPAGTRTFVGRINGSGYFVGDGTSFGSGGPWVDFVASVPSGLAGGQYQLELFFDTRDPSYNDYRGWGVDCIQLYEAPVTGPTSLAAKSRRDLANSMMPGSQIPVVKRDEAIRKD